uniref:Zinc finger protein n=1 Tax=Anopheles funestus TaxID=62324 RepID=A0A182RAT1_ANOFN
MSSKHCRICYKSDQDDLISVRLLLGNITIEEMILNITSISVSSDCRLPQNICLQCLDRLKAAYELRQQCIQMNDRLCAELEYSRDLPNTVVEQKTQTIPQSSTVSDGDKNDKNTVVIEIIDEDVVHESSNEPDQIEHNITAHYIAIKERNFACCGCAIDFSSRDELEEHVVRTHSNGKTYPQQRVEDAKEEDPEANESVQNEEYILEDSTDDEVELSIDIDFSDAEEEEAADETDLDTVFEEPTTMKSAERTEQASIQRALCLIPGENLLVVSQEQGYAVVEMQQHRCCCCAQLFPTEMQLNNHLEQREQNRVSDGTREQYACEYCGKQFTCWLVYVCHKRMREQRQFYMCTLCNAVLDSEKRMISHMLISDEHANHFNVSRESIVDRYRAIALPGKRCCCCKKYFDDEEERMKHMQYVHGLPSARSSFDKSTKLPYCCGACGRRFRNERLVERHLQYTVDILQYYCNLCDFETYNPRRMELHLYSGLHRDTLPVTVELKPLQTKPSPSQYCCFDGCEQHFQNEPALKQHINLSHQQVLEANRIQTKKLNRILQSQSYHECNVCSVLFKSIGALQAHQAPSARKGYLCVVCGVSKRTRAALRVHERSHTGERPFRCEVCDKTFHTNRTLLSHRSCHITGQHRCKLCGLVFNRKENLNRHIMLKHGEATIQCDLCPKKFKTVTVLNIHKLSHTGEKRFKCRTEGCDKRYITACDRRRHEMSVHTFERPHKCSFCNAAFIRKHQLTVHERRHTGDKPFVCPICGKDFVEAYPLRNHMRNVCQQALVE